MRYHGAMMPRRLIALLLIALGLAFASVLVGDATDHRCAGHTCIEPKLGRATIRVLPPRVSAPGGVVPPVGVVPPDSAKPRGSGGEIGDLMPS